MKLLALTFILISCSKVLPSPRNEVVLDTSLVREKLAELELEAESLSDENGWLVSKSCDSMLWSGKACLNITDLESAGVDGRYYRTPSKTCFADTRSASSFSRDMSLGLLNCLIEKKNLAAIERHIEYGDENGWIMGEGAINRTYYTPALIGLWYKAARVLGHDYGYTEVSNVYPSGLTDYQAHLQMLFIHLTGTLENGQISDSMRNRIHEHSDRIPTSGFYAALSARYGGPVDSAINLCLDDDNQVGDYVRCDDENCELAERIFTCKLLLGVS